ncbi:MAG TPA: 2-dehydropantoate 2-reductase [Stellaceae bacterium]|nr:2-dehydropantoate 2-reductase [Stellaceae bacterium]
MDRSESAGSRSAATAADAPSTIAVVGVGSIGGIVAACLTHDTRYKVVACARRPLDHLALERPEETVEVALHTVTDPTEAEPVDWVLLCTKTHATASAAPWLRRLCRPSTHVVVLQNGIDHVARVSPFVAGATVVPAIVYFNGERVAGDRVRLRRTPERDLAVPDGAAGRAFAHLLEATPLRVSLSADFTTLLWRKLLLNATANPITALTRQRQSVLRRDDMRALCLAILGEATAIARADGAQLADDEAERVMSTLLTYPAEAGTSMYFDCLAGRPLEVEALTGAIVAGGERHGIATPINRTLLVVLRAISDAAEILRASL